jgi:hypothetical protein
MIAGFVSLCTSARSEWDGWSSVPQRGMGLPS